jgi:hypothetical protein
MKIKIDKHIPVPPSGKGKKSIEREALELMELGDSFAYDRNDTEDLTNDRVVQAISAIKKVNKRKKFITRSVSGTKRRVWRIQ